MQKSMIMNALLAIAASALGVACGGEDPVNLGENQPAVTGEKLADYSATWEGYVEAATFPRSSDRVAMTLDENGHGTITFGVDAAPLPPIDDPDVVPPWLYDDDVGLRPGNLFVGFAHTVEDAHVEERRLRLSASTLEPYEPWCELQTSYETGSGDYECLPPATGGGRRNGVCHYDDEASGEEVPVDCGKVTFCHLGLSPCDCDADGCTRRAGGITLDGVLEDNGDTFVGTLKTPGVAGTVRLARQ